MALANGDDEHPWQRETRGTGLVLHAPAALEIDLAALRAQVAGLAAVITPGMPGFCGDRGSDTLWGRLILLQHNVAGAAPVPMPGLAQLPMAMELAARHGWQVMGVHLDRQPPGSGLSWHWDDSALHRDQIRLMIPVAVPEGARTRVGHEPIAYPPGRAWTADFTLVHDVWNLGTTDRVSLVLDLAVTPAVTALFPEALAADPDRRNALATLTREQLLQWWAAGGGRSPYPPSFRRAG